MYTFALSPPSSFASCGVIDVFTSVTTPLLGSTRLGGRRNSGQINKLYDPTATHSAIDKAAEELENLLGEGSVVHTVFSSGWEGEDIKFPSIREYDTQGSGGEIFDLDKVERGDVVILVGANTVSDTAGAMGAMREGRDRDFKVVMVNSGTGTGAETGTEGASAARVLIDTKKTEECEHVADQQPM